MALTEVIEEIQWMIQKREKERELLESIAALSDRKTADLARDIYDAKKHTYSFDGYLYQLSKLQKLLVEGVPSDIAIEAADSCIDVETIITFWRGGCE